MSEATPAALLADYRDAAERTGDPDTAAEAARDVNELYKQLRDSPEGRAGLTALMLDPNPHVRRWAATHSLSWKRDAARQVLMDLNRGLEGPRNPPPHA